MFLSVQVDSSGREAAGSSSAGSRKGRKPGRKGSKVDMRAKLERSRQSARECRARKKIRYQYLDELVADREKAVLQLRKELDMYTQWARSLDEGVIPEAALQMVEEEKRKELLKDRQQE
ncbi:hypothetical protein JTE90_019468 [Oedothorax gibbosus]|uniref:BZIP domain-containing protein n=1 Tax=Oedothorax gibbosus TaxID=931172 RepID=A0AAV6UUM5_9ARAC|nr:hypothetical protein JTE90_019468 [Oedothorax gibbosus]